MPMFKVNQFCNHLTIALNETSIVNYVRRSVWRSDSSKFFDTQVPSVSTDELVLPRRSLCTVLSSLQRTQSSVGLLSR